MNEMKWEVYLMNGHDGEIMNIKNLTEEQRRKLDQRLNEQCAAAVVIKPKIT